MDQLVDPRNKPSSRFADLPKPEEVNLGEGITSYHDLPVFALLQHAAEQVPDRTFVVYGDERLSFSQLNQDSIRAAAMLQRLGVKPGDRVGILLPNVPEYIVAANAIWRCGAIAVAISPLAVETEVQALLDHTDCKTVISLDVLSHLIGAGPKADVVTLLVSIRRHLPAIHQLGYLWVRHSNTGKWKLPTNQNRRWFWEEVNKTEENWRPISVNPATDPCYILPTGGTTGSPKAVMLSHTNMVANAWQQLNWTGNYFGTETMMAVLPFFHSYGMSTTLLGGAAMGGTLVLHHKFNLRQVIQLIEQHKPSVFHSVPAMLSVMNERFRTHPLKHQEIRWVISGGAPLKESIGDEFAKHSGALVVEGYGLSEASPCTHVGPLFDENPNYGTIGMPLPETECRIIKRVVVRSANDKDSDSFAPRRSSESTERTTTDQESFAARNATGQESFVEVADGEVGELTIRGPQVMLGYWKDSEATADAIRDGFLHTGDLAIKDADGFFRIVGRQKDLIITSGFNVYPGDVEKVLRDMESTAEAGVIGHPDEQRGEIVKAYIVLKPGAEWDVDAIKAHCRDNLSKHKQPKMLEQWEGELPKNFLGKILRRHLREASIADNETKA